MKCFLVVNQLNNPIFLDFDAEFTKFIHKKAVELGLQDGSQPYDSTEVDTAVVTQLFSPLVLSQVPLDDQVQNPCTSIVCPNGFLLAFRKVDDIQYIAISGDGTDTEDFLQRKIVVYIRLTKFLFGPVYTEIANCSASERAARWSFLRGLMNTWAHLASSDQSFLVEAVERLHINQLVSEKCVGLLEKTVRKMQASADQPTQHAFLLVGTKLLALYSKRSSFELLPADILVTTLLAQEMFPCRETLGDMMMPDPMYPTRSRQPGVSRERGDSVNSINRDEKSDDNEEFHSAPTTPSQRSPTPGADTDSPAVLPAAPNAPVINDNSAGKETAGDIHSDRDGGEGGGVGKGDDGGLERLITGTTSGKTSTHKASVSSGTKDSTTTSSSAVEEDYPLLSPHAITREGSVLSGSLLSARQSWPDLGRRSRGSTADGRRSIGSRGTPSDQSSLLPEVGSTNGGRSRSGTEQSTPSVATTQTSLLTDYWPHSVFLQTPPCQHAPHALHCAQILPGITLVVVSQMSAYAGADPLCQVLSIFQDLLQGRRNKLSRQQGLQVHDVVTDLIKRVYNIAKKHKRQVQNSVVDVLSRWDNNDMREKLIKYLQQEENQLMVPELESPLMELQRRVKDVFQQLFVVPGRLGGGESLGEGLGEVVSQMKIRLQQELMDYRDYLSVKAQRNITMTSYLDDFPGLVHFIYIDRQYHQVMAPSFNIMSDHGRVDATLLLKDKVWTMYSYMMKKLQQGYTSVLLRDGDFYYSFFLWFEDGMGNPMLVDEPYRPGVGTVQPGILSGAFYKRLLRQCFPQILKFEGGIHCYEMFMMHVGLVTPSYIATHCRKLAHKLWEMSGEAYTPVNLL